MSADPWHGATPRLTLARPGEAPEEVAVEAANPYRLELEDVSARSAPAARRGWAARTRSARRAPIEALYAAAGS